MTVGGTCSGIWWSEGKESVYNRTEITNKTTVATICLYRVLERAALRGAYMMPPQPNLLLCEVCARQRTTGNRTEIDISMERHQAVHRTCLRTGSTTDVTGLRKGKDSPQWPLPSTTRLDQNHLDIAKPRIRLIAKRPCFADKVVVTHGHGAVWAQIIAVRYCPKHRMHQVKNP